MLIKEMKKAIKTTLKSGLVPMMFGSPGLGKSDIVRSIAKSAGLKVIDLRLSQCDPCDMNGFPKLNGNKATYLPMDTFPIETDTVPEGYKGYLLFLDELNSASKAVQASAYKLILDRQVGMHKLHPQCFIIGAGNKDTDGAIVNTLSSALRSRFVSLELDSDPDSWLEWATNNDLDYRVISFIKHMPERLHRFDPSKINQTFACPRTWEMVSKMVKNIPDLSDDYVLPLLEGTVGGTAMEFITFAEHAKDLPKVDDIIKGTAKKVTKIGEKYLITTLLSMQANSITTEEESKNVVDYLSSLGREYPIIWFKGACIRAPKVMSFKPVSERMIEDGVWITK